MKKEKYFDVRLEYMVELSEEFVDGVRNLSWQMFPSLRRVNRIVEWIESIKTKKNFFMSKLSKKLLIVELK